MTSGSKTLAIVLLFLGLVLVNYLATSLPARFDATAEKIYTLSPGTKALLSKMTEPTTLDLYFSSQTSGQFVEYKNYAERVREMLRQYVRASGGKVRLNAIDPEPDTPEGEKATAAGVEPQTIPGGSAFYFGLVATQADQQKVIAALTPQREQFLEYDVSELIYGVGQADKKKLGLITSLPLQGSSGMPMMGQQGFCLLPNNLHTAGDLRLALLEVIVRDGLQVVYVVEIDILQEVHLGLDVARHREVD